VVYSSEGAVADVLIELEPVEQAFVKELCLNFFTWLKMRENPDSVSTSEH
jgi:hypothetical protein